jgi:methionine synthase I (cobalamin-dependent)/5,10-methylenetetrahydrofolate reductase
MANIIEVLRERLLVGDGATGTYLQSLGWPAELGLEEANLYNPDLVSRVYREYVAAGAQLIEVNSFGANRVRLARHNLENKVAEINAAAVRLVKEAIGSASIFIGGSVGPLCLRPFDTVLSPGDQEGIFREQIQALLEAGCDIIMLETFTDLDEALLALRAFRQISSSPVGVSLAVSEEGRLASGQTLADAWTQLRAAGADLTGLNGTCGPQSSCHLLGQIDVGENDLISAFPNAGKPEFYEGRFSYAASPEYFAASFVRLVSEGARLVGGDYGTTPAHVAAMAAAARGLQPVRSKRGRSRVAVVRVEPAQTLVGEESSLLDLMKTEVVSVVELDSPKTLSMDKFLDGARALKKAGAAAVTLADNSLAILRVSNIAAAVMLREKVGATPLLHISCRDRNLLGLQSDLLGLGVTGFRHVLALTGDPAKAGDHPGATSVYDVNSVGLIKLLRGMNNGVNAAGRDLKGCTRFIIGCAFNPNSPNIESQRRKLESKIAAGAQYVMTQPVFDPVLASETGKYFQSIGIPAFIGVMPVLHARNADFLHNEVPGIKIPDAFREKLRQVDDKKAAQLGLELAKEIRQAILEHSRGLYIITPFMRYDLSLELL